ncbi:hypothetical protein ACFL4T_02440, partial [candidate division KSB1 bacterium]
MDDEPPFLKQPPRHEVTKGRLRLRREKPQRHGEKLMYTKTFLAKTQRTQRNFYCSTLGGSPSGGKGKKGAKINCMGACPACPPQEGINRGFTYRPFCSLQIHTTPKRKRTLLNLLFLKNAYLFQLRSIGTGSRIALAEVNNTSAGFEVVLQLRRRCH